MIIWISLRLPKISNHRLYLRGYTFYFVYEKNFVRTIYRYILASCKKIGIIRLGVFLGKSGGLCMKKMISILILGLFLFSITSMCFAATPENVITKVYSSEEIQLEDVPKGSAVVSSEYGLPKTGGIPAEIFYGVGVLLVAAAVVIAVKPKKASVGK